MVSLARPGFLSRRLIADDDRPETYRSIKPNLALIGLPTAVSLFNHTHYGAVAVALIILWELGRAQGLNKRLNASWLCAVLPALSIFIMFRPNDPTTPIDVIFFAMVLVAVVGAVYISNSRAEALVSLHDGVGVLLASSVALWLAGFQTAIVGEFGRNVLTGGERVLFPLSNTLAAAPTVAAAYIAALPLVMSANRRYRIGRLVALIAGSFILVQSDRRSALAAVAFALVILVLAPRMFRRLAPWATGIALTLPFLTTYSNTLNSLITSTERLANPFRRVGEDTGSFNGRLQIWEKSLHFYQSQIEPLHQMFGFGTWGHVKSGASSTYSSIFAGLSRERAMKSPHSSLLQVIFDGGWVAAVGFTSILIGAAWVMSRRRSLTDLAGLAMLTVTSQVAGTENLLAPAPSSIPFWMTLVIVTITFSRETEPAPPGPGAAAPRESRLRPLPNTRSS